MVADRIVEKDETRGLKIRLASQPRPVSPYWG